jgi:hypothetical protein
MNDKLKTLFLKRFNDMMELVNLRTNNYMVRDKLAEFELKRGNELEFRDTISKIPMLYSYNEYQMEILSDMDVMTYMSLTDEEKKIWINELDNYVNETNKHSEYFDKLNNIYDTNVNNIDEFINFLKDNSTENNSYIQLLTNDNDTKKSLFYCYLPYYIYLIYNNIIIPIKSLIDDTPESSINTTPLIDNNKLMRKNYNKQIKIKNIHTIEENRERKKNKQMIGGSIKDTTNLIDILVNNFKSFKLHI